ncbi:MAG: hypothetical protein ACYDCK_07825, partial [Thermoplasmatota archaeon]
GVNGRPVLFVASANATYANAQATDAQLAVDLGATFPMNLTVSSPPKEATTYRIVLPSSVAVVAATSPTSYAANVATILVDNTGGATKMSMPLSFTLGPASGASFSAAVASLNVTVDMNDLQVSLGGLAKGNFGTLVADIDVKGDLHVIALTPELKAKLPKGVSLDFVSSDGLRALLADGKVSDTDLASAESSLKAEMEKRLTAALGSPVTVTGGFTKASLADSLVSHPFSDAKPVVFEATAHVTKSLSKSASTTPATPAAIFLFQTQQTLSLPRLEGLDTLYHVILPRGIAVASATMSGGTVTTGTSGGRDYFDASPTASSGPVTVAMAVTPTFVVLKFLWLVILLVVIIVLLIALPIVFAVRAKRRRAARAAPSSANSAANAKK